MNVCVCVKVVPDRDKMSFDVENGTMARGSGEGCLNPADLVALEVALGLVKEQGGCVHVVSMGPPGASATLRGAFFLGAEEVFLLASPVFAGADVPATAYTLSRFFASRPQYDLILCGKCSADGNTGQLGAYLAELMGLPHLGGVTGIESTQGRAVFALQRLDGRQLHIKSPLPCLMVAETDMVNPHTPTLAETLRARARAVQQLDAQALPGLAPEHCGLSGSATKLAHIFVPEQGRALHMVDVENDNALLPLFFPDRCRPSAGTEVAK